MKQSLRWILSIVALGVLLALWPAVAAAQTLWTGPDRASNITLEWLRPDFDEADDLSFFTSTLFLSGRVAVADEVRLVADFPVSFFSADAGFAGQQGSDVAVGNPYFGLEWGALDRPVWGEVGLRVPLTPDFFENDAVLTGFFADYDRCEAFMPDVLSVVGVANYQYRHDSGFSLWLRGGPLLLIETKKEVLADKTEGFAVYSLHGWYDTPRLRFGAGLTGRLWATESDLNLAERTVHHLGLALAGKFGGVEPGLHFRLPLDEDLTDFMNFAFGINVRVPFGQR